MPARRISKSGPGGRSLADRRVVLAVCRLAVGIVAVALWEGAARAGLIDPFFVSSPARIAGRLVDWAREDVLLPNLIYTLTSTFAGYALGAVAGVALGFLLGGLPVFGAILDPVLDGINSMPRIALGPLFTLWLGIDLAPKALMAASLVFFIVLANTRAGVREVNPDYINVLRIMGANRQAVLRKVILPSAARWIFASLQVALPWALMGAVAGEMIASPQGVGYQIMSAGGSLDATGIFAGLAVLMAVGLLLTGLVRRIEARLPA